MWSSFAAAFVAVALIAAEAGAQVRGSVASAADSLPIASAEVRRGASSVRTKPDGTFFGPFSTGDSIVVRALGFRETRFRLTSESPVLYLEPVATVLPVMVTTAGNRVIRSSETPASVTVVSEQEIAATAASGVNQVLRQLPGLEEVSSPPSRSSISMRGLSGPRVLVLIDGEPTAGALIDNRDIGRLSTLSVERIELTKGPSSVEFGSDALGGVINLVTAPPAERLTIDALVRGAELGRREASGDVSGTAAGVGYRLGGGWRQADRLAAITSTGSTLHRVYDARGDARWREREATGVKGVAQWTRERQRWPLGGGYNGFVDDLGASGVVEGHARSSSGSFRLRLSGQLFSYKYRQASGDVPIAGSGDSLEQRERVARALLAWHHRVGAHDLDAGVQYSSRWMASPGKVEGDSANDRIAEFYAKDTWRTGPWLVSGGARYSSGSIWGDAVTPTLGAAVDLSPRVRLRANVARGFRAPGFKEIRYTFANPSAGYTVVGNPDLKPEQSTSLSLGGVWSVARGWVIEGEAYRNDLRDMIDLRITDTNQDGLQVYRSVNVGLARIDGLELSARGSIAGADLTAGVNRFRPVDRETGRPLEGHASTTGLIRVSRSWTPVTADLSARYTGAAQLGNGTREAMTAIDAQVRWRVSPRFEMSLGVNNLLDHVPALWTPALERQVYAGLRTNFQP